MIKQYFEELTDKRQTHKVKHNMLEIIIMTICAVIAGCEAWEDIADYCRVKESWFKESLRMELKYGIASHDTIQRVFEMLDPKEFEKCFREWINEVCNKVEGDIVSIDGKTIRRSGSRDKKAIHMVSAWANKQQVVLGQMATDKKSNEITAVPKLLDVLEIKGCIVTADAMSCQKEIVKKINEKEADYVLALKENQQTMLSEVKEYFEGALEASQLYPELKKQPTLDKGHGRIEKRTYYLSTETDWFADKPLWQKLNAFGMVMSEVEREGKVCRETRYYITSLDDINKFSEAVRKHWGIENSLHWCLDMTFHEDYNRSRKGNSAENMAVVRHLALNALKANPEPISLARKKRRCSYDDTFLADIIHSFHA